MAKPDNRADNVPHLKKALKNTAENLREAEQYLDEHADEISPKELNDVIEKNRNRRKSMESFENEIEDES
ncbi:small acid-soluble spore protein Tlp [Paenibacillus thailandensis]|jgi:small acid-soluble spore protein (thioredoxin-like protein)|uniref:Small acid-soluble spore protein Tlp n=1 Tax=Paenibacillus thailandensis TaxID=393250 RepID=A0ABW5QTH3_9BACL